MNKTSRQNIEQPLGRILSHAGKRFLDVINEKLSTLEIERNFYALLLIEQNEGKITQQDLATMLHSDKVSLVRIIDYLCGQGYVERVTNSTDKRKYGLLLTDKAKKDIPKIKKALKEVTALAFKDLKPDQIGEFLNTLNIIKNNLTHKIDESA